MVKYHCSLLSHSMKTKHSSTLSCYCTWKNESLVESIGYYYSPWESITNGITCKISLASKKKTIRFTLQINWVEPLPLLETKCNNMFTTKVSWAINPGSRSSDCHVLPASPKKTRLSTSFKHCLGGQNEEKWDSSCTFSWKEHFPFIKLFYSSGQGSLLNKLNRLKWPPCHISNHA